MFWYANLCLSINSRNDFTYIIDLIVCTQWFFSKVMLFWYKLSDTPLWWWDDTLTDQIFNVNDRKKGRHFHGFFVLYSHIATTWCTRLLNIIFFFEDKFSIQIIEEYSASNDCIVGCLLANNSKPWMVCTILKVSIAFRRPFYIV